MGAYVPPGFKSLRDFVNETIDRKHSETSDTPRRLRSLQEKLDQTSNAGWGFFERMDINEDLPGLRTRFEGERKIIAGAILDEVRSILVQGKLESVSVDRDGRPKKLESRWWIKSDGYESIVSGRCGSGDILVIIDDALAKCYINSFDEEGSHEDKGERTTKTGIISISKIGDETKAKAYLVERMTKSPKKPPGMNNKKLLAELRENFKILSGRAFERAKAAAIEETGAVDWKAPGR